MSNFYFKKRVIQRIKLESTYKSKKYNKKSDKFEIAKAKKIEKRKTKTRLDERTKKDGRLEKNNLTIELKIILLEKKGKGQNREKKKKEKRQNRKKEKKGKGQNRIKDTFNFDHKNNNRVIWVNLNYKDELTKFRPYLIKSIIPFGKKLFLFELLTITSKDWKADFKYKIESNPQCFKKDVASFIYLNTLVYMKAKKKDLKSLFKCDCKNCLDKEEYNLIIAGISSKKVKRIEIDEIIQI
ncbi:38579_t:CDS:1 [Gigaspora margarita]|uniref:38579_t:CDS:1 n=1 Tax=Gigaspora margarita TaxID=4874 RepID=A0ABN7VQ58_GIGMA|nr:38579_t:CDS:1 [Gigaspora margarita]